MTREDHLKFCSVCLNRKMDMERGLVCTLTGQFASFDAECRDFKRDESVKIEVNSTDPSDMKAVREKLPISSF